MAPCAKSHHQGLLSKCSNLFAAAHVLGYSTVKGECVAQTCGNTTQALSMIHSFLRLNVLAVPRVVQMH